MVIGFSSKIFVIDFYYCNVSLVVIRDFLCMEFSGLNFLFILIGVVNWVFFKNLGKLFNV